MKFFTDPVAIVLEADMLHVSILFLTNHARGLRWKPDLGVPKSIVPICIYLRPYFARAERDTLTGATREKSYAGAISLYTTRSLLGCLEPRKTNTMRTAVLQGASRE